MRQILFSMTFLFLLTAAIPVRAQPVATLHCEPGDPPSLVLCEVLRQALLDRGYTLSRDAPLSITLMARRLNPTNLAAHLRMTKAGVARDGPEGVMSILDHDEFPRSSLSTFATALIERSGL